MSRYLFLWLVLLLSSGCTSPAPYSGPASLAEGDPCRILLAAMDRRLDVSHSRDALGYPLPDYPYLRSDRFLASFSHPLTSEPQRRAWHARLFALGSEARALALDNLTEPFSSLARRRIESCIATLAQADSRAPGFYQRLVEQARVPDGYQDGFRLLGLFPLTRLPVLTEIDRWKSTWGRAFNDPLFFDGERRTYYPTGAEAPTEDQAGDWLARAGNTDPLGIPALPPDQLRRLFDYHAPVWQVQTESEADRIGAVRLNPDGLVAIDTATPRSYLHPSYTRLGDRILLQLNYSVWFPERPARSRFDLYAGRLDGLIWRVTLTPDGRVLAYDSIHACGCYHYLLPVASDYRLKALDSREENPLIISSGVADRSEGRVLIRVGAVDHYLLGLAVVRPDKDERDDGESFEAVPYDRVPYDQLRSLPYEGGRRSLFGDEGRVAGTERPERYLFWPMGVPSAGAVRIWGQHLISFTGRRHFDEARLLEHFLEPEGAPSLPSKRL